MSIEKSIGWTDMTCNPIKGKCKGGCWYCYTKPMYKMGRLTEPIRIELSAFRKLPKKKPRKVFLCSTHDLFGDWIPKIFRDAIFKHLSYYPHHTFQILTKFPQNIDRPMPDNVWLGATLEGSKDILRIQDLLQIKAKVRFISIEPFMSPIINTMDSILQFIDWVIIGRLTGYGDKFQPEIKWIGDIVKACKKTNTPIFLKDNLKEIFYDPSAPRSKQHLIQEMPR